MTKTRKPPTELGMPLTPREAGPAAGRANAEGKVGVYDEVARNSRTAYRAEYRPGRAMTFLDRLWRDGRDAGTIDYAMYRAGLELRSLAIEMWPRSEGVSSYGDGRVSDATGKADRAGQRLTGIRLNPDGSVPLNSDGTMKRGRRQNYSPALALDAALLAACGCYSQEGKKLHHKEHAEILMRIVLDSDAMPTLAGLTQELQQISGIRIYGDKAKQGPPYTMGHIHEWLGSAARHFGFAR
jgi:hypothetical protein